MNTKTYHGITVNDLYNSLYKNFNLLVDEILKYESDTFSSSESEITPQEAEKISFAFIIRDMEARIHTRTMDGIMISEELYELRLPVNSN